MPVLKKPTYSFHTLGSIDFPQTTHRIHTQQGTDGPNFGVHLDLVDQSFWPGKLAKGHSPAVLVEKETNQVSLLVEEEEERRKERERQREVVGEEN